jgi:hypothetical protein
MFEIGARLFARGAVSALIAGFINVAALLVLARPGSDPLISWWNVTSLAFGSPALGLWFAPLTMLVLPLTWLAFRRSRYRPIMLIGTGLLGGVVWSLELLRYDLSFYPSIAVGALSGLGAAACFLGQRGAAAPARSEQASTRQPEA